MKYRNYNINKIWKTILPVFEYRSISSTFPPPTIPPTILFFTPTTPTNSVIQRESPGRTAQNQAAAYSDEVDCKVHETLEI